MYNGRVIVASLYAVILMWGLQTEAYEKYLETTHVPFHQSMQRSFFHNVDFAQNHASWQIAEQLYNTNIIHDLNYAQNPRIPLILHHIWLGSPLPEYASDFRKSWIELNPDWTFILWTDHPSFEYGDVILHSFKELEAYLTQENRSRFIVMNMHKVSLYNQVALQERTRNYGEKSDLIRYEALYQVGGLYVDTDFECIKSFTDLHHAFDFYVGMAHDLPKDFSVLNGLLASAPHHPIMAEVILQLRDRPPVPNNSLLYTGPHFLTEVILHLIPSVPGRTVLFPVTYFYPKPFEMEPTDINWIEPESYAVHHWKMSWQISNNKDNKDDKDDED